MQANRFFSIVMPVYNQGKYLASSVESVLAQSHRNWELILVNDGSTDSSLRLIDDFVRRDARIRGIHQGNSGAAVARNRGIAAANSEWITYLDSDDVWFPDTLQTYSDHLDRHPSSQFLYGFAHQLCGNQVTKCVGEFQTQPGGTRELFCRSFLRMLAVCHHRSCWEKCEGFDPALRSCEDYDLFLRMSLHCRLVPIGKATGLRRRHDTNLSKPSGRSQQTEAAMLSRFARQYPDVIDDALAAKRVGQVSARAARCYFHERNYAQALWMADIAQGYLPSIRTRMLSWVCQGILHLTPSSRPASAKPQAAF